MNKPASSPPLVASADLLDAQGCLRIIHGGEIYILRRTRNNKLILTK
jgi:hemin uptake protein HemP